MRLLLILWASLSSSFAHAAGTIILLVDISSSISVDNLNLQMDSYASAMEQMSSLHNVNIEVIVFHDDFEHISTGSRDLAANAFRNYPRLPSEFRGLTCMVNALYYIETLVESLPPPIILDISGDGEANCAGSIYLHESLDYIADKGVRVNTLLIHGGAIFDPKSNPYENYKRMTRNNGFSLAVKNFYDFENSLFEKLTLEVSQLQEK